MSDSESDTAPVPVDPNVSKKTGKPKRKVSEAQLANLKHGFEAIKAKREALAKERAEFEEKKQKGEVPADAPIPRMQKKQPKLQPKVVYVPPPREEVEKVRKIQQQKVKVAAEGLLTKDDLAALKAEMMTAMQRPAPEPVVKEVPVEKIVDRVVHKERIVTGSEMLNQIFGLK
jgi:hypothetical protein